VLQGDLKGAFEAFANFGTRQPTAEIDGAKFAKLCKDCKLLDKAFTATVLFRARVVITVIGILCNSSLTLFHLQDVDLIFSKVRVFCTLC
jgi:hypothetical protein